MSKIFRLHTNGSGTVQDWQATTAIIDTHIKTIADPAGEKVSNEITSIPTPFARIDLAKTAFARIASSGHVEGNTIYHKIVADCLDVAELFFRAPQMSKKLEIITWNPGLRMAGNDITIDPSSDLGTLLGAASSSHKLYGKTLEMFLKQDAAAYNFREFKQMHLLHYKDGPQQLNIIGGTSPATLFFSSANNLSYVNINLGARRAFSGPPYVALHCRSQDFILFLYSFRASIPSFPSLFKEVEAYLIERIYPLLAPELKAKINALTQEDYAIHYSRVREGDFPEVLGHELRGIQIDKVLPGKVSDFVIKPTKQTTEGALPLALPSYTFGQAFQYVDGLWNRETKVPYKDERPMAERTLPDRDEDLYPYLNVSDFLEPYLFRLPFATDGNKFFNGHLDGDQGYMLPLKKETFKYFSAADIQGVLPGTAIKMFELKPGAAGAVEAILRIPIKKAGQFIEMRRTYYASASDSITQEPAETDNRGVLLTQHVFTIAVYPFLKTGSDAHAHYRVLLADADNDEQTKHLQYSLTFYKDDAAVTSVPVIAHPRKADKREDYFTTEVYVLDKEFDLMEVGNGIATGLVVPKFPVKGEGATRLSFAVDFGTTNTHVEWSTDATPATPLKMEGTDSQLGLFHRDNDANFNKLVAFRRGLAPVLKLHENDLLPAAIGDSNYFLPQRTVISEPLRMTAVEKAYSLSTHAIHFTYERRVSHYLKDVTELKWGNVDEGSNGKAYVQSFIEEIVMMIRNKALLNQGTLQGLKIVWFFPTSMASLRRGNFERMWKKAAQDIIGTDVQVIKFPEALAPFYEYRRTKNAGQGNNYGVNIDIGGGTTDIVLYKGTAPIGITSFRFAGNAIFGDGYGSTAANNGFIQSFFKSKLTGMFNDPNAPEGLSNFKSIYENLLAKQKSNDLISFLFSFKRYPEYKNLNISFTEFLQGHSKLKVVPLLAFSAIIYYLAQWMKTQNLDAPPSDITFSGSGSRFLNILDESSSLNNLTSLARKIFTDVWGAEVAGIKLKTADNPKEITAKGGLYLTQAETLDFGGEDDNKLNALQSVWPGVSSISNPATPYAYKDITSSQLQHDAVQETERFFELFKSWHRSINFKDRFGVDMKPFDAAEPQMRRDVSSKLQEGINRKLQEVSGEEHQAINETLFFYPLTGLLNELATSISEGDN